VNSVLSRILLSTGLAFGALIGPWHAVSSLHAAGLGDLHHGEGLERCITCHTDRSFGDVNVAQGCTACHVDGDRGGPVRFDKGANEGAGAMLPMTVGMDRELYYETSRFGAAPGPMVRIPAGKFRMGSDERMSDEAPLHTVHLDAYLIDRYEVTNLQYQAFIEATGRRPPSHFTRRSPPPGKVDHPVTFVSWFDARDYCAWAGKRLPTEQEWEKAARGADGRVFPWGNEFDIARANTPVRWARIGVEGDTTPVGSFAEGVSPYGLHDMAGNVWEWTESWYLPHPGNDRPSENFGEINKVLKGGSWWDCSFYQCGISAPVFNRSFFNPRVMNSSFGFRCAKDAGEGG
jgi:gamma-glutamyl hercynylcysteine S-oxide synthase